MFDLNQAIRQWKRSFRGKCAAEDLTELETHLLDLVEEQMSSGLTGEDAFARALARIGAAEEIRNEFAKIRSWDECLLARFRALDWPLLAGLVVLCAIGLSMIYSAVNGRGANVYSASLFTRQAIWLGKGNL